MSNMYAEDDWLDDGGAWENWDINQSEISLDEWVQDWDTDGWEQEMEEPSDDPNWDSDAADEHLGLNKWDE